MDSHIDTADPWAAVVEEAEVSASVVEHSSSETEVDEGESVMYEATQEAEAEPEKGGLFGRRKPRTGQAATEEIDGGFSLMSPAPLEIRDDPQFETAHSEALEPISGLGSTDDVVDPPGEDALYRPLEPVDKDVAYGSVSSSFNPPNSAPSESLDFDNVSEEIANAVEEAQPAGIFGALSNPGSMLASADETSPVAKDQVAEGHNSVPTLESVDDVIEKTEDSLDEIVAETDDSLETFVEASHDSLADVLDDVELEADDAAAESSDGENEGSSREIELDEGPADDDAPITDDENIEATGLIEVTAETHEASTEDAVTAVDSAETKREKVTASQDEFEIPADPFGDASSDVEQSSDLGADDLVDEPEEEEPVDTTDETTQDGESADLAPEEESEMELRKIEDLSESTFSLTNAPAESVDVEEGLFVSTGAVEEVQRVVLVTTDTVPGMEMGDSCGLVTAVHAAADATDLVAAIEKTHAELGDRASEVGATAVISVTTAINEVQAGFLVVASGTAVVAAN